jgi:hypothetical protein
MRQPPEELWKRAAGGVAARLCAASVVESMTAAGSSATSAEAGGGGGLVMPRDWTVAQAADGCDECCEATDTDASSVEVPASLGEMPAANNDALHAALSKKAAHNPVGRAATPVMRRRASVARLMGGDVATPWSIRAAKNPYQGAPVESEGDAALAPQLRRRGGVDIRATLPQPPPTLNVPTPAGGGSRSGSSSSGDDT